MKFLSSSAPVATCDAAGCEGCTVAGSIQCHFGPGDLVHVYLIFFPILLVGGAGALAIGVAALLTWVGIIISFFGFIEIRVMCSHCPRQQFWARNPLVRESWETQE